jgi:hypothetical protein
MPQNLFTNLPTTWVSGNTISSAWGNNVGTALNVLEQAQPIYNATLPPYNAVPDEFYSDGVVNGTTTFTSATAVFTGADVGKHITILNAGSSGQQPLTTTIASFTNSTTVVLSNASGQTQTGRKFYLARGGDQTSAIQSAIDACSAAGGGEVLLPAPGFSITTLVLKSRVILVGNGHWATMLRQRPSTNAPIVRNDYTLNANAAFGGLRDLCLQGGRSQQSDFTTTLSSNYAAGAGTLVLTSVTGVLPFGSVKLTNAGVNGGAPTWLRYVAVNTGTNTLTVDLNGIEGSADASFVTAGTTVTIPRAHGLFLYRDPPTSFGANDDFYDLHYRFNNVFFFDIKGDGFIQYGQAVTTMTDCAFEYVDNVGLRPSWDSFFMNLNIGNIGRMGCVLGRAQIHMTNVTSYFCGGNTPADGHGYFIDYKLPASDYEGMITLVNCTAQDNKANGLYVMAADRLMVRAFGASTNSASSTGTYAGVKIVGMQDSLLEFVSVDRGAITVAGQTAPTQANALDIDSLSTGNQINLTHGGTSGVTVGPAIKSGSDLSGGNQITIGSQGGTKTQAYATPFTPDPYVAEAYEMTLTGNLTINAPANAHMGTKLRFRFIQDGTGGRTMTFNAALPAVWGPDLNAGAENLIEFQYNGTAWKQTLPDPSAPITRSLTADVTNSTVTVATMTDLDFAVLANRDYTVVYNLTYQSGTTTTGIGLQVGVSGSTPASIAYDVFIAGIANTDAAGVATTGISGDVFYGLGTAIDDLVLSTGVVATATNYPARVVVNFRTGGTGGTVSIKQRSEVAATTVTFKRGSTATLYPG